MHDFISYILWLFREGMFLAVPAAGFCAIILAALYITNRRKGKPFPIKKALLLVMIVVWGVLTVFATLLRTDTGARALNFHLFLAWKEAWNGFSLQGWLNIFLNIALFIPLGILLPLFSKRFRRSLPMLFTGTLLSFAIELAQFIFIKGISDIDDLFANILGTMLGWGIIPSVMALAEHKADWKKQFAKSIMIPVIFLAAMAVIFGAYYIKPYGNLSDAATVRADLKDIQWTIDFPLSDAENSEFVYEAGRLDKEKAESFINEFSQNTGIEFPDTYYYDDLIIFADHSTGDFLNLNLNDGTWEYKNWRGRAFLFNTPPGQITADELAQYLSDWGITVPDNASFKIVSADDEGCFDVSFSSDKLDEQEEQIFYGTILCTFFEKNGKTLLKYMENNMVSLKPVKEEMIISQEEAVNRLCDGTSFNGRILQYSKLNNIEVTASSIDWIVDTKGFYQPVYRFELMLSDGTNMTDYVPALK